MEGLGRGGFQISYLINGNAVDYNLIHNPSPKKYEFEVFNAFHRTLCVD